MEPNIYKNSSFASAEIDQGLRTYMLRVYNYMAIGLFITAIIAYFVSIVRLVSRIGTNSSNLACNARTIGHGFLPERTYYSNVFHVSAGVFLDFFFQDS